MNQGVTNNIMSNDTKSPVEGIRVNEMIRSREIRLIDQNGEMVGVVSAVEGVRRAKEVGLDLVEVSPNALPPVCKILDFGKFKYEVQKKKAEARKNQKIVEIKEIKLRPVIDTNDYNVKLRNAQRFLQEGNKVKVTMRFRGRERTHLDLGMNVLNRMKIDIGELGRVESEPKSEEKQIVMVIAPK
jgi:translation initiation factor IF-3